MYFLPFGFSSLKWYRNICEFSLLLSTLAFSLIHVKSYLMGAIFAWSTGSRHYTSITWFDLLAFEKLISLALKLVLKQMPAISSSSYFCSICNAELQHVVFCSLRLSSLWRYYLVSFLIDSLIYETNCELTVSARSHKSVHSAISHKLLTINPL